MFVIGVPPPAYIFGKYQEELGKIIWQGFTVLGN
jgi:hypothetical protein